MPLKENCVSNFSFSVFSTEPKKTKKKPKHSFLGNCAHCMNRNFHIHQRKLNAANVSLLHKSYTLGHVYWRCTKYPTHTRERGSRTHDLPERRINYIYPRECNMWNFSGMVQRTKIQQQVVRYSLLIVFYMANITFNFQLHLFHFFANFVVVFLFFLFLVFFTCSGGTSKNAIFFWRCSSWGLDHCWKYC